MRPNKSCVTGHTTGSIYRPAPEGSHSSRSCSCRTHKRSGWSTNGIRNIPVSGSIGLDEMPRGRRNRKNKQREKHRHKNHRVRRTILAFITTTRKAEGYRWNGRLCRKPHRRSVVCYQRRYKRCHFDNDSAGSRPLIAPAARFRFSKDPGSG